MEDENGDEVLIDTSSQGIPSISKTEIINDDNWCCI